MHPRTALSISLFAALLASAACGGDGATSDASSTGASTGTGSTSGGQGGSLTIPKVHRASAIACTGERPPGDPVVPAPAGSECSADADCTKGDGGRCVSTLGGPNTCSYDDCGVDADCGGGSVCDCDNAAHQGANTCFHGDCVVDADCPGAYCSPSAVNVDASCTEGIEPGSFGYFCHVAGDECTDDADCASDGTRACIFQVAAMHWACHDLLCSL